MITSSYATGGLFGQVSTTSFTFAGLNTSTLADLPMSSLMSGFSTSGLSSAISGTGLSAATPTASWGIDLGGNLTTNKTVTGPLASAIPYIYVSVNSSASISFGTATSLSSNGNSFEVALDPADPAIYAGIGLSAASASGGIMISEHGEIPYTPLEAPTKWTGSLYGNLYINANIDIAGLTDNTIPLDVSGDILMSFDTSNATTLSSYMTQLFNGQLSTQQLKQFSFAVDGTVSLSVDFASVGNLQVQLAKASFVYDANMGGMFFKGGTVNPTDSTALSSYITLPTSSIDGEYLNDGYYNVHFNGNASLLGLYLNGDMYLTGGDGNHSVMTVDATADFGMSVSFGQAQGQENIWNVTASASFYAYAYATIDWTSGNYSASFNGNAEASYSVTTGGTLQIISGLATVSGGNVISSGDTGKSSENYSSSGNLYSDFTALGDAIQTDVNSYWSSIETTVTSWYVTAMNEITSLWNQFTNWWNGIKW